MNNLGSSTECKTDGGDNPSASNNPVRRLIMSLLSKKDREGDEG